MPLQLPGILHSSGNRVITIDEDLQHHPDQIVNLLEEAVVSQSDVISPRAAENVYQNCPSRLLIEEIQNGNGRDWKWGHVQRNGFHLMRR